MMALLPSGSKWLGTQLLSYLLPRAPLADSSLFPAIAQVRTKPSFFETCGAYHPPSLRGLGNCSVL